MAKKAPGLSKQKPKSEAIPLGTKKPDKKPAKPKKSKPATDTASEVTGEREATAGEIDMLVKRREVAVYYLNFRDDMPVEIATEVVGGLEPEEVGDLYEEATTNPNFSELYATLQAGLPQSEPESQGAPLAAEPTFPDFTEFEVLLTAEEDFPGLVQKAIDAAKRKNEAEKEYKDSKAAIIALMDKAGTADVMAIGIHVDRYEGKSPKRLDPLKLVEKGVSVDVVNACYVSSKYDDVRLTLKTK